MCNFMTNKCILYHKKDNAKLPSNFRPITLQPVFAKVFTSIIRNRIYSYLVQNEYIETNIQKGFWKRISGTIEHNELLNSHYQPCQKKSATSGYYLTGSEKCLRGSTPQSIANYPLIPPHS